MGIEPTLPSLQTSPRTLQCSSIEVPTQAKLVIGYSTHWPGLSCKFNYLHKDTPHLQQCLRYSLQG